MSMKLGRIAALLSASFLIFACEEEQEETEYTLMLIEAPTRLPYDTDGQFNEGEDGYDTMAVRFSVALSPSADEIDTIICRMLDYDGFEVAEMLLFDDGNEGEHHGLESWQQIHTGDSIAGDFIYSSRVIPADVVSNYSGANYTLIFEASFEGRSYAQTSCNAETWISWVLVERVSFSVEDFTLCTDSVIAELTLARDSLDFIDSVKIGRITYYDGGLGSLLKCVATSGDTSWRGVIRREELSFFNWSNQSFAVQAYTRLGHPEPISLSYTMELSTPGVNTSVMPDTVVLAGASDREPVAVMVALESCPEDGWVGPVGVRFLVWVTDPEIPVRVSYPFLFNDLGEGSDSLPADGIFTGTITVDATQMPDEVSMHLALVAGIALEDYWEPYPYLVEDTTFGVSTVLLPAVNR